MFVLKSTYDTLNYQKTLVELELIGLQKKLNDQIGRWNDLVEAINAKGGESFLQGSSQFSDDEIKKLLQLCHPDKHDGKTMAVELTAKLLKLRKS